MNQDSLMTLVLQASPIVQAVMGLLLMMSIAAWAVTFAKSYQLRKASKAYQVFESQFWAEYDLTRLYNDLSTRVASRKGAEAIFEAGFKEYVNLKKQDVENAMDLVAGTQRAMRVAYSKEVENLENNTGMLATVGSSAPYIGLFGTVWGVMDAFSSLGDIQNATLSAVAPGISEALIATAMGLFAAIPAVIAYNRLLMKTDKIVGHYESFADGFLTIIQRQSHEKKKAN